MGRRSKQTSLQRKHTGVPHLDSFICGGHLDCFCILAVVNSAAVNTEVHVFSATSKCLKPQELRLRGLPLTNSFHKPSRSVFRTD